MRLVVGTRGSRLSLVQTEIVISELRKYYPDVEVKIKVIRTLGDLVTDKPLFEIRRKGIFEKEVDRALLRGEVDFAVHSMKDLPTTVPEEIELAAVPKRGSPYDVLLARSAKHLRELPKGAVVGTSSPRRVAQILYIRPDLQVKPIRGNVDTRVRKLQQGLYDAIVIAEVGLQRLGFHLEASRLPLEEFTPAPGQGALAVVARRGDENVLDMLRRIDHYPSRAEAIAERAFVHEIGGGCKVPLGAVALASGPRLSILASILSPDGRVKVTRSLEDDLSRAEELGRELARLMARECSELIASWRL